MYGVPDGLRESDFLLRRVKFKQQGQPGLSSPCSPMDEFLGYYQLPNGAKSQRCGREFVASHRKTCKRAEYSFQALIDCFRFSTGSPLTA